MSISHLSLVNQKLAYASAIIKQLNEPQTRQQFEWQALADAAVFHLAMGLHFYLRELAEHHRIKNLSAINYVEDLVAALQQSDGASSESSELLSLAQTKDTWLSQLIGYYARLSKSPEKPKEKKAFGQENLIELLELTEVDEPPLLILTPELLASWLDSFRALVVRQRDTSAEY
jgi:hypothetical protein